jgi:hypothetical protein
MRGTKIKELIFIKWELSSGRVLQASPPRRVSGREKRTGGAHRVYRGSLIPHRYRDFSIYSVSSPNLSNRSMPPGVVDAH